MKTTRNQLGIVSIIMALTVVLPAGLLWAEEDPNQIISKLEAKAEEVKTYSADMTMTMEMMGEQMATEGKMLFKKPKKSRMEMTMDMGAMKMEQLHICDGKTYWMYNPMMKMVTKVDMEKIAAETQTESAGQKTMDLSTPFKCMEQDDISFVRTDAINNDKVYVFHASPDNSNMQGSPIAPDKIEMWISDEYGLLRKMVMLNEEGKAMMSQSYSNIRINIDIDDNQFEFTPPEGAQIMDMTEATINMTKQMKEKDSEATVTEKEQK